MSDLKIDPETRKVHYKHSAYFKLEVYTTNPRISEERFLKIVSEKLLAIEMLLNEDMQFRFHIHDDTKPKKVKHGANKRTK